MHENWEEKGNTNMLNLLAQDLTLYHLWDTPGLGQSAVAEDVGCMDSQLQLRTTRSHGVRGSQVCIERGSWTHHCETTEPRERHLCKERPEMLLIHSKCRKMRLNVSISFSNVWALKSESWQYSPKSTAEIEEHISVKTASFFCTAQGCNVESWTAHYGMHKISDIVFLFPPLIRKACCKWCV